MSPSTTRRWEPTKGVRRFSDHKTAVRRVLATLGNAAPKAESTPEKAEPPAAPAKVAPAAPKPAPKAEKAPAAARETVGEYVPADGAEVKPPRPESKRAGFLARLQSAQGITLEEAEAEFGWKSRDVRDVLFQLAKRQGYHTKRDEQGRWRTV